MSSKKSFGPTEKYSFQDKSSYDYYNLSIAILITTTNMESSPISVSSGSCILYWVMDFKQSWTCAQGMEGVI